VIATSETLALLARSAARSQPASELAVPLSRPFTLGTIRLELFPSGHALGASGLSLSFESRRVVYAGDVCPRAPLLGAAAQVRSAEIAIVGARYGPDLELPDRSEVAREVVDFCLDVSSRAVALVLVSGRVKGLEVAAVLAEAGLSVRCARSIHHLARKLSAFGTRLPSLRRLSAAAPKPGQVLVVPSAHRSSVPALPDGSQIAWVSGAAARAGSAQAAGANVGFAWSSCADYNDLMAYVGSIGASEVYVTGPANEVVARAADRKGLRVVPLGPPKQRSLL